MTTTTTETGKIVTTTATVKPAFAASSVGRFLEVVAAPGSPLASGVYFVEGLDAKGTKRGCEGDTSLILRNATGTFVMGWREASGEYSKGVVKFPRLLSVTVVTDYQKIIDHVTASQSLTATVEVSATVTPTVEVSVTELNA